MTESNNVKFVEAEGKWLWKRYDENGSVIYRSPLFNTEREAREDYDVNGGKPEESSSEQVASSSETTTAPENQDATVGSATSSDENQVSQGDDNNAGQATI
jgi:hypothetical protein